MAEHGEGRYRKRVEDVSGGLAKEDESRKRRPSSQGLALESIEEARDAARFEFVALADRLGGDSDADRDGSALPDFGIGSLLAEQKSETVRQLLEKARAMMSASSNGAALGLIEEALAADGESSEAWAMKGRCLTDLGHHEAALRVLHCAREKVTAPELRVLILRSEATCIRATTKVLEERLGRLVEERQLDEALALVREGLRRQPSNIVFLHHLANLHWMRGEEDAARRTVVEARRHVGRESGDLIAELERKIDFGAHKGAMEAARLALRQGRVAVALEHLDGCQATLEGNEHYDGLRAYAEQGRRGTLSQLLRVKASVRQGALRQQTLRWLLAEDLREADQAWRAREFRVARSALESADAIAPDCGAVSCKLAATILAQYRAAVEAKRKLEPERMRGDLEQVEELLERAAADADMEEQRAALHRRLTDLRQTLAGRTR